MKCKLLVVIVVLISLVAGYFIGNYRARLIAYNNMAFFVTKQLEMELRWQENATLYAYLDEPPAVAAWALESLINAYHRYSSNVLGITGKPETEYQTHEMFAHARLSKVYSNLDMAEKAQLHLDRAISLSNGKNAEELMKLVGYLDKAEEKMSQQGVPGYRRQSAPQPEP